MTPKVLISILAACVLVIVGYVLLYPRFPFTPFLPHKIQITTEKGVLVVNLPAEESYWTQRIQAVGGVRAFSELGDSVKDLTLGAQHVTAHAFGKALYEVKGMSGFSDCGAQYGQGCLHQFFGLAVQERGMGALKSIEDVCASREKPIDRLNCEHGLGHGIAGYLGYSVDDLMQGVSACAGVVPADRLSLGCLGGVFMEYNFRSLISSDAQVDTRIRQLTPDNRYAPCDIVPKEYTATCMFWQPWWWHLNLSRTPGDSYVFNIIGSYCRALTGSSSDECFKGIGYMIPNREQPDMAEAARLCSAATENAHERILCWTNAVVLIPQPVPASDAALCGDLKGEEASFCSAHYHDVMVLPV